MYVYAFCVLYIGCGFQVCSLNYLLGAEEEKTSVVGATDGEEVITNPAGGEPQHISKNELKRRAKMAKFEIIKKERRYLLSLILGLQELFFGMSFDRNHL